MTMSQIHFVIPPSQGNVAGIERVTLICARQLRLTEPRLDVIVHMFGDYSLPAELAGAHVIFHPHDGVLRYGRHLRPSLRQGNALWVVCQPMTLLALALWSPLWLLRQRPAVIFHGGLHIEMQGARRHLQFQLFALIARCRRLPLAAVSRSLARYAEQRLGLRARSVRTLNNPVLDHVQVPESGPRRGERFACIAVGRLHEQKGFDLLIDAFHRSAVGPDAELLIAGEGPQRPELERRIAAGPKAAQIRLLGYREDVPALVGRADLYVMSSRYEGLAGALVEALASGIRVVCTDHPYGAREALAEGRFGRLVSEPFEDGLKAALDEEYRLWQSGHNPRSSPKALESHLRRFTADFAAERYRRFIDRLAEFNR
jgi:glycosyltransferase involved in cell wall biosynthesis